MQEGAVTGHTVQDMDEARPDNERRIFVIISPPRHPSHGAQQAQAVLLADCLETSAILTSTYTIFGEEEDPY